MHICDFHLQHDTRTCYFQCHHACIWRMPSLRITIYYLVLRQVRKGLHCVLFVDCLLFPPSFTFIKNWFDAKILPSLFFVGCPPFVSFMKYSFNTENNLSYLFVGWPPIYSPYLYYNRLIQCKIKSNVLLWATFYLSVYKILITCKKKKAYLVFWGKASKYACVKQNCHHCFSLEKQIESFACDCQLQSTLLQGF